MFDLLRKYVDSLVGVTELSRDRAETIARDLQKRGELRAKDLRQATDELLQRSVRNRRELVSLVQKEIRRQVRSLGLATREDVDKLARRVKQLESTSRKSTRKSTSRTGAKRTSAAKKTTSPSGTES